MGRTGKNAKAKASGKALPASKAKKNAKPTLTADELAKNKSYIGRRVSKKFDGAVYNGTVTKFTQKHHLWAIKYDDDDAEEMDWKDLSNAMDLHDSHDKKGKNKGGRQQKRQSGGKAATPAAAKAAKKTRASPKTSPIRSPVKSPAKKEVPVAQAGDVPSVSNYRVIEKIYPSNGSTSDEEHRIVGEYATREEAEEAAKTVMLNCWAFQDWGEGEYGNLPPPYSSANAPKDITADDDDFVDIYVVDIAEDRAEEERELAEARNSKPPPKPNAVVGMDVDTNMLDPTCRKFGRVEDRGITVDANLFARNPCRIEGAISRHPNVYPNYHKGNGSFGFLIQRLSDRNYAMRALCLNGYGAEYNTYRKQSVSYISVVWYPPTNLNEHAKDESIVDGCHLDLIDPTDGKTYLTGTNLKNVIVNSKKPVECVFLNGAQSNDGSELSAEDIASALEKCNGSLLCLSMTECKLNANLLATIASCTKLRGLILENCQLCGEGADQPTDKILSNVLSSCPDLRWCYLKSSLVDNECWTVLAAEGSGRACPNLEVLWVDSPIHTVDRIDTARGNHDTIRKALDGRANTLKLCKINPDQQNKSRYVLGGGGADGQEVEKEDRLDGTERSEESKGMIMKQGGVINGSKSEYLNAT